MSRDRGPRHRALPAVLAVLFGTPVMAQDKQASDTSSQETILFIRHAEKPADGLGQLSCKGLNRALALPMVLNAKFGRIDAVFAPDPSHQKPDGDATYDYVRPLMTVEPTAIRFGLPVHADLGYSDIAPLRDALLGPEYRNATVLVGWEHHMVYKLVSKLVASFGGDAGVVPKWEKDDFDSVWRVTIERTGGETHVAFAADHEGLDGQPVDCPK